MYKSKTIELPESVHQVLRVDPNEVSPDALGLDSRKVLKVWLEIEDMYRTGVYPAMAVAIRKNNQLLFHRVLGHQKGNGPDDEGHDEKPPMTLETPVCLFSASKCITAVLIHWLAGEGELDLDQEIGYYLPDFKGAPTGHITAMQLLEHRAGIPAFPEDSDIDALFDPARALKILAQVSPEWRDNRQGYHAVTGGYILGALLERQTGKTLRELVDTLFREPMGLNVFNYGLSAELRERFALNYATGSYFGFFSEKIMRDMVGGTLDQIMSLSNSESFLDSVIPSANFISTAYDVSLFFQMLMDYGAYEGKQILKPAMVETMLMPGGKVVFDRRLKFPVNFNGGFIFGRNPVGAWGINSKYAFGHLGFTNNLVWADPKKNLSVALLTTGNPFLGKHLKHLLKWMYHVSTL